MGSGESVALWHEVWTLVLPRVWLLRPAVPFQGDRAGYRLGHEGSKLRTLTRFHTSL